MDSCTSAHADTCIFTHILCICPPSAATNSGLSKKEMLLRVLLGVYVGVLVAGYVYVYFNTPSVADIKPTTTAATSASAIANVPVVVVVRG